MKVTGIIRNKRTKEPIPQTHIILSVKTTEIAGFYSDNKGLYECDISEEYKNQIIGYRLEKDGFKSKEVKQKLKEEQITLNIEMEEE